jgi:hypothetical protein
VYAASTIIISTTVAEIVVGIEEDTAAGVLVGVEGDNTATTVMEVVGDTTIVIAVGIRDRALME